MRDYSIELTKEELKDLWHGVEIKKRTITGHQIVIRQKEEALTK